MKKTFRQKIKPKKKLKKGKWSYLVISIFLFLIYVFIQGDHGFYKYIQLYQEKNRLLRHIEELKQQQKELQNEIDMLKTNYRYIEKIAREERLMAKKGEKIYRINPPKKEE